MKLHKEGYSIIRKALILWLIVTCVAIGIVAIVHGPEWVVGVVSGAVLCCVMFVMLFFRCPTREWVQDENTIFAPADGKIVVIEEVDEKEFFGEKKLQVSVFMSLTNIHINWFPITGKVVYFKHHHGQYRVAWHPKSSEDNERTTTVVQGIHHTVLFRQIAGFIARRIVSYAEVGAHVEQNTQCGFIKFGSRVDLFLPLDTEVLVKLGDKVVGTQTPLARLKG